MQDIDLYKSRIFEVFDAVGVSKSDDWFNWSVSDLNQAHKFVFPKFVEVPEVFKIFGKDLRASGKLRLPFDRVILEFPVQEADGCVGLFLFCSQGSTEIDWTSWGVDDPTPFVVRICPMKRIATSTGHIWKDEPAIYLGTGEPRQPPLCVFPTDYDKAGNNAAGAWIHTCTTALATLASDIFAKREIIPPNNIQKLRAKRNKAPLFRFSIVELNGSLQKNPPLGGTHSSPALHWRRGHLRRLSNKIVPVSPCLVGSIKDGLVDKGYVLGANQ